MSLCAHPIAQALWKRLGTPGHDAAFLFETEQGYELRGTAAFKADLRTTRIAYRVEQDRDRCAQAGHIAGATGETCVVHHMAHSQAEWSRNGMPVAGLAHLPGLDFGFTRPQTCRHCATPLWRKADLPAGGFNLNPPEWVERPQHYRRQSPSRYGYQSPAGYRAVRELAPTGFVRVYPGLWEMV